MNTPADPSLPATAGATKPVPALPADAREHLDRLRKLYPTERALLLPALHLAQKHWDGWLPEEAILAVAAELGLPPAEVYGVVTFYDLYHERPVGRHRIRVCTNVPCMLRGSAELMAALAETLGVEEGEVTPDGRCSFVHFECLGACEQALAMEPPAITDLVKASGLRGRGGAGFPTGMKWGFIPKEVKQKYLVVNADESEPGTFKDRVLMEHDPHQLIEGSAICCRAVGASMCYIYIRGEYVEAGDILERAIADAYAQGVLGKDVLGSGFALEDRKSVV